MSLAKLESLLLQKSSILDSEQTDTNNFATLCLSFT